MTELNKEAPKISEDERDRRISRKARTTRLLEKVATYGSKDDQQAYRRAQRDRDAYIDSHAGQP